MSEFFTLIPYSYALSPLARWRERVRVRVVKMLRLLKILSILRPIDLKNFRHERAIFGRRGMSPRVLRR